jgi:hypothetical protein
MRCADPMAGGNRHFGPNNFPHSRPLETNPLHEWVADGKRRRINLLDLLTAVVVSPWANDAVYTEVEDWTKSIAANLTVHRSRLTTTFLPTLEEFRFAQT